MTIRFRQHITNRWQHNCCFDKACCSVWLLMDTVKKRLNITATHRVTGMWLVQLVLCNTLNVGD